MDIKKYFDSLTHEQIEEGNNRQLQQNKLVHKEFSEAYKKGYCSLCKHPLVDFVSSKPCYHWFLRPHGIKKKHFAKYLSTQIGFFRFDSYMRWVANLDAPFRNINDLKSEMNPAKVVEYTIRYKNIEWTINMGKTDRIGHADTQNASFPHFHLQIKVDDNVFIRFNDFHIPLSNEDIFSFRAFEEAPEKVVWRNSFGEGMSIIEDEESLVELEKLMRQTDDVEMGTFDTSTLVQMPEGEQMDGEELWKIFEESKRTGIPARHLLQKHYPQATITTEIGPGQCVPEMSKRTTRK